MEIELRVYGNPDIDAIWIELPDHTERSLAEVPLGDFIRARVSAKQVHQIIRHRETP